MRHAVTFTNVDLLAEVAGRPSRLRHLPAALFSLALASACVATARPEVSARAPARDSTVILVIDASLSMQATDVRPSRLGAAEDAVRAFVDRVPQGMRIGLVDFSGDAQVAAAPTDDRAQLLVAVRSVGRYTGFGGTAIGDALVRAVRLGEGRDASILFLSDGKQNRGIVRPLAGARRAREAGMRVYTVALGTTHGRLPASLGFGRQVSSAQSLAPDPTTLRAISELTGGSFFSARTAAGARSAYAELGSRLGWRRSTREVTYEVLGLAALLLVAAWGLSLRSRPRLP